MAEKIEIHDAKLSRRVDDLVMQLRECYPDGKVAGLNARHKTLSNRIGEIWRLIGYETRDDFFDAYGFEFVRDPNAVFGRPVTVDGEELLSEVEKAVDELGEILCDRASGEKPGTIADLIKLYPDQGAYIDAGKKMGVVDRKSLQLLGILPPTKAMIKNVGVRNAPAEKLAPSFSDAVGDVYVGPGDSGSEFLPPFVVGYDTKNEVELRTALIAIKGDSAKSMHIGDTFEAEVITFAAKAGPDVSWVKVSSNPPGEFKPIYAVHMFDDVVESKASKLSGFVGAKVVSVLEHENDCVAQLELTYLAALRSNTMIYVLRKMGIVKDVDVAGGLGWRFRMRMAARENANHDVANSPAKSDDGSVSDIASNLSFEALDVSDASKQIRRSKDDVILSWSNATAAPINLDIPERSITNNRFDDMATPKEQNALKPTEELEAPAIDESVVTDEARSFDALISSNSRFLLGQGAFTNSVVENQNFIAQLRKAERAWQVIEVRKGQYWNISQLQSTNRALTSEACNAFVDACLGLMERGRPYTIFSLRKLGITEELDALACDLGLDDYLLRSILSQGCVDGRLKRTSVGDVAVFCRTSGTFTTPDMLAALIGDSGIASVGDLVRLLAQQLNINLLAAQVRAIVRRADNLQLDEATNTVNRR